ncbi:hypothetical protein BABINDRAFT_7168 [Babjeviella inositovora NRRL Y-12698]|uniref:Carboxylic ester hydrolase n=1 Tax=Babjeviella inositovora NRRL Y-12698 TaxID=984486 RepID=A0A1E3QUL5_9ASCO|nr:uncharacterized protein BABINDRAFT_7168 [Babjeviella inositovora NRRL Y-12698]ODQ81369.1 hypothetical protein BABINDRAFT_7168 [Babjeviella inositovora NRRL Y-12698]
MISLSLIAVLQLLILSSVVNAFFEGPQVKLPNNDVITGRGDFLSAFESYLGIPFAAPPVGDLRFRPPQAYNKSLDGFKATKFGKTCPQLGSVPDKQNIPAAAFDLVQQCPLFQAILGLEQAEDCLSLNIFRKQGLSSSAKLPVMFWIFGGGFMGGASTTYLPQQFMTQGALQGQNIIYVSVNYRLAAFGFLGGKEIKAEGSGNVGLMDQRLALEWVADNIASFGGDPDKVTIFGESAGSISVAHQMIAKNGDHTYKGRPLFRAAIMQSGTLLPTKDIDSAYPQQIFDAVANAGGCGAAFDKLACLRSLPYDKMQAASSSVPGLWSYKSLQLSYMPRPDGNFIPYQQMQMVQDGKYARVPYIVGNQEDEGSVFALSGLNITTDDQVRTYLWNIFPDITEEQMSQLQKFYQQDVTQGSPYGTGHFNALSPQYKRLASVMGDLVFQAPRRFMLDRTPDVARYTFLSKQLKGLPIIGTFHGNDIIWQYFVLGTSSLIYQNAFISFAHDLNPNSGMFTRTKWPKYQTKNTLANNMLCIRTVDEYTGKDNYRKEAMNYTNNNFQSMLA